MKRTLAAIVVLIVVVTGFAFAQNTGENRPATIEELYLSQEIEIQIISSQARSNDRDAKLLAIETVRKLSDAGELEITPELFTVITIRWFARKPRRFSETSAVLAPRPCCWR